MAPRTANQWERPGKHLSGFAGLKHSQLAHKEPGIRGQRYRYYRARTFSG